MSLLGREPPPMKDDECAAMRYSGAENASHRPLALSQHDARKHGHSSYALKHLQSGNLCWCCSIRSTQRLPV